MGKWKTICHPGAAYFLTATVVDYTVIFDEKAYAATVLDNLDFYRKKYRFRLYAYVIMPEHLHLVIHSSSETRITDIMRDFKSYTSKKLTAQLKEDGRVEVLSRLRRSSSSKIEQPFGAPGNRAVGIYSENVLRTKVNYIHANPLRRGLVEEPADYPYSSYRNYYLDDESLIKIDKEWLGPHVTDKVSVTNKGGTVRPTEKYDTR